MSGLGKVKMSAFVVKIGDKNAKRGHQHEPMRIKWGILIRNFIREFSNALKHTLSYGQSLSDKLVLQWRCGVVNHAVECDSIIASSRNFVD